MIPSASMIADVIAPAAILPACALLLVSTTSRMNTLLARIRAFHHERLDVWNMDAPAGSPGERIRELRLHGLEHQTNRLLLRADLLRLTLLFLFLATGSLVVSVAGLTVNSGLGSGAFPLRAVSLGFFIAGLALMFLAMVTSVIEVVTILETARYEHRRIERLIDEEPPASGAQAPPPLHDTTTSAASNRRREAQAFE